MFLLRSVLMSSATKKTSKLLPSSVTQLAACNPTSCDDATPANAMTSYTVLSVNFDCETILEWSACLLAFVR